MDVNCYILFNKNNRVLSIISLLEADMEQKRDNAEQRQCSKLIHANSYILFNKNIRVLSLFSLLDTDHVRSFVNRKRGLGTMGNDVGVYK